MLQLTPSAVKSAKENLAAYVEKAKTLDIMKSNDAPVWDDHAWDVSAFTKRPNATASASQLKFGPIMKRSGGTNVDAPYVQEISSVLKAYVAHKLDAYYGSSKRPSHGSITGALSVSRRLIDFLVARHGLNCLTDVQVWQIEEYLSTITSNSVYSKLRIFLVALRDQNILPQIVGLVMKGPSKRACGEAASSARVPTTWDEIVALGSAFYKVAFSSDHQKIHSGVRFWTSCATLLATTPSRSTELWRLPANLEVVHDPASSFGPDYKPLMHEDQSFKYGLRWWPAKGGQPIVKFVPTPMVEVARRAIEIIKEYTDEPRKLAKWIIENPGKIPIPVEHRDIEVCRTTGVITDDQIKRLFGFEGPNLSEYKGWQVNYRKTRATRKRTGNSSTEQAYFYDFSTFEADWMADFQRSFPTWPMVVDDDGLKLRADDSLMVCYRAALDPRATNKSKIFLEVPKQGSFHKVLAASEHDTLTTLFEALEIRLPDGSFPRIQSHDLRHFLNTMAQRAGVPQKIIAAWSGRKDVGQNMVYDHRTDAERVQAIGAGIDYDAITSEELMQLQMTAFKGEIAPPSNTVLSVEQSNFNQVRKNLFISITQSGFCLGDLREEQCPRAQNCISCSRYMICAGAEKSTAIFRDKARIMNRQLDELRKEKDAGRPGITDAHVEHMAAQVQGANEMLLALNDRETVDGTPILRAEYSGAQRTHFAGRVIEHRAERLALMKERKEVSNG